MLIKFINEIRYKKQGCVRYLQMMLFSIFFLNAQKLIYKI